jgi:hypothetical protein
VCESHLLVLFAWEGTIMKSTSACQARCGAAKKPIAGETNKVTLSTWVESSSVQTGNDPLVVPTLEWATVTSVQGVGKTAMELKIVLEHRKNRVLTEYKLLENYPFIPQGLQFGFDAGIHPISSTFTPDNIPTLYVHTKQYQEIMDQEFSSGRYIGPCSKDEVEELLGPFQSSPLSLVPKPGKAERY